MMTPLPRSVGARSFFVCVIDAYVCSLCAWGLVVLFLLFDCANGAFRMPVVRLRTAPCRPPCPPHTVRKTGFKKGLVTKPGPLIFGTPRDLSRESLEVVFHSEVPSYFSVFERFRESQDFILQISDFKLGSKQTGARIRTQNHSPQLQCTHYHNQILLKMESLPHFVIIS